MVASGIGDLVLLLLSFLLFTLSLVCPGLRSTFAAVWLWWSITIVTLLVQTTITSYDLVVHITTPDDVYPGSLANSLMYMSCQALYVTGVAAYFMTQPAEKSGPDMPTSYAESEAIPRNTYTVENPLDNQ